MFLGGEPDKISGETLETDCGAAELSSVTMSYQQEAIGSITVSMNDQPEEIAYLVGTEGRIKIHAPFWESVQATLSIRGKNDITVKKPIQKGTYGLLIEDVMNCLREGSIQSRLTTHRESLTIAATLERLRAECGWRDSTTGQPLSRPPFRV